MKKIQNFNDLLNLLETDMRLLDKAIEEHQERNDKTGGPKISCKTCPNAEPGCCFQKNHVYFFEVLPIVRYMKRHGLDTPELRARLLEEGEAMEAHSRREWFEQARPCVFLKSGRCSIYSVRPTNCRTYFVATDPANCQPESNCHEIGFVNYLAINQVVVDRGIQIHRAMGLKESPYRILVGALPRLVLVALEAWESEDYVKTICHRPWPNVKNLGTSWLEGNTPFREKLYQIRKSP